MPRKHDSTDLGPPDDAGRVARTDQARAQHQQQAQERLQELAGGVLPTPPWRPAPAPPSAIDLTHFALSQQANLTTDDLCSALALLPAARDEIDGLETGLLFTARSAGLTWAQIADAMGFNSPQACQQHFHRLTSRGSGTP